jgi:hypothetical protein
MSIKAISPIVAESFGVSISTSSASAALPRGFTTFYIVARTCDIFVKWGTGTQTATPSFTGHIFLPSGSAQVIELPMAAGATVNIAGITDSGTGTLSVTPCTGGV